MIQRIRGLVYDCFEGKREGIGQTVVGLGLYALLLHQVFAFANKQDFGYSILRNTPVEISVEFEPGLQGTDTNRDGNLDTLISQIASYRPPIMVEREISPNSELFKRTNEIYHSGFLRDARLNLAGSE